MSYEENKKEIDDGDGDDEVMLMMVR